MIAWIAVYTLGALYALWALYLVVQSLDRARKAGTLRLSAKILGAPLLAIGVVLNVAVNATLLSLVFLERPREWFFSRRVSRHCRNGSGWRKSLACWICRDLLDAFDPDGRHC